LVKSFPHSAYAPAAHWRAAWAQYRLRNFPEAARLMDEQIQNYPGGQEIPGALYWRGRLYEQVEHNTGQAANYYRALINDYPNTYYSLLAHDRLGELGAVPATAPAPFLAYVHPPEMPALSTDLPENDPHLIRARLLANAALNEYIAPEIQASAGNAAWGALAEAEIYASYGEDFRALETLKHANLSFFSYPAIQVPWPYWQMLFPRPYWSDIVAESQHNGLDPYLVAALIRQESEFNPAAVSRANAYGLMQLLPSVGKSTARTQGLHNYKPAQLLDPHTNIVLGTADLAREIQHSGGQIEYALAAYNAGDNNVRSWQADDNYQDTAEFVESIPFGETRNYVQAILRNREMYRTLYPEK
jgi:soluble lytic murein transglycosylase